MNPLHPNARWMNAAGVLLLAITSPALAADVSELISGNPAACGSLNRDQAVDLKLLASAQQGRDAFLRYVRFYQPFRQWTTEEAVIRAQVAANTRCAVAIGLKPLEQTEFATIVEADAR